MISTREQIELILNGINELGKTDNTKLGEKAVDVQIINACLSAHTVLALMDIADALKTLNDRTVT